jgi:hypothetical protein
VTFTFGLAGKITGIPQVTLDAPLTKLKNCLVAALKGIQFPQPQPAAASVTVSFSFTET